ncbi:MAG: STAS/SEC14 domain-containing protein [Planctomycetales bacterium]|nr:STAS/SEC14 domain-containing protein [Planctomycetales bacterium]
MKGTSGSSPPNKGYLTICHCAKVFSSVESTVLAKGRDTMASETSGYELSIPEGKTWVHLRFSRSMPMKQTRATVKQAIDLASEHGLSSYLVELTHSPADVGSIEQYQFIHGDLVEFGLSQFSRIALVGAEGEPSPAFAETVFRNAGYSCRLFHDLDEATRWLQSQAGPKI